MNVSGPLLPEKIHRDRMVRRDHAAPLRGPKQFGSFDGMDNRREMWILLDRLDRLSEGVAPEVGCARRRVFFGRCCAALQKKTGLSVKVGPDTVGTTRETYLDVISLTMMPGWLDIESVAKALERYVKELGL